MRSPKTAGGSDEDTTYASCRTPGSITRPGARFGAALSTSYKAELGIHFQRGLPTTAGSSSAYATGSCDPVGTGSDRRRPADLLGGYSRLQRAGQNPHPTRVSAATGLPELRGRGRGFRSALVRDAGDGELSRSADRSVP